MTVVVKVIITTSKTIWGYALRLFYIAKLDRSKLINKDKIYVHY